MVDSIKPESLLVADIGSVNTRVGLIDFVTNDFRFVASGSSFTTATPPMSDVTVGVRAAIRQIQARAERTLLNNDGGLITPERPGGQGVDAFVAITSAATPLRVAIVGLSRDVSIASATRAIETTHSQIVATLALDDSGGRWLPIAKPVDEFSDKKSPQVSMQDPSVVAAEMLASTPMDVIVLVGGIDGGATAPLYDMANLLSVILASRDESARPIIIFAGNGVVRSEIANRIGSVTALRVVDNVRPTLDQENLGPLQLELENQYAEKKIAWLPGITALSQWTSHSIQSTTRAFENLIRFLSRRHNLNVMGVDVGGAWTTAIAARKSSYQRITRANLGLGQGAEGLLSPANLGRMMNWLALDYTPDQIRDLMLNQTYRPGTIPATPNDAQWMQTAARVAIQNTACDLDSQKLDLVVLAGGICGRMTNFGALALLTLDALQPSGIFTLAVDSFGLASAFGGLASINAQAAASVIERDGLTTLGTVIAPLSNNREGQLDVHVRVKPADSGAIDLEVPHGSLELIPLAQNQKASIQVRPARGVDLGNGKSGVFNADIEGGALGLIIDARGRPMNLPTDLATRRAKIQRWYWDMGNEVTNV